MQMRWRRIVDGRQRLSHHLQTNTSQSYGRDGYGYLQQAGFVRATGSAGLVQLLPLGQRVVDKITGIIHRELNAIGALRLSMTGLVPSSLWRQSGRLSSERSQASEELFHVNDRRQGEFLLAPTHEEDITALVGREVRSWRDLPLRLYQTSTKWRDEARPRGGLLRGREFIMNDLYTFDGDESSAMVTYEEVTGAYGKIFNAIGLPYLRARATSGAMGGSLSHEYHFPSPAGEDVMCTCACGEVYNTELPACFACGEALGMDRVRTIEVGHTFHLGTRYTEPFDVRVLDRGQVRCTVQAGCHGIGVSRLLGAIAETKDTRWPRSVAPYEAVILQAEGKEEESASWYDQLLAVGVDAVLDDRLTKSMAWKLKDASLLGYPFVLIPHSPTTTEVNGHLSSSESISRDLEFGTDRNGDQHPKKKDTK